MASNASGHGLAETDPPERGQAIMVRFILDLLSNRLIVVVFALALIPSTAGAGPIPQAGTAAPPQPVKIADVSPKISAAIPAGGISFPTEVTVTGQGFKPGAQVTIGSLPASIVSVAPTEIHITAPGQPAGTMDVTVTNLDGSSATQPKFFTYTTGPIIYAISPQAGSPSATTAVHITGGNFHSDSVVTFGGLQAQIQYFFSATSLDVEVPANAAGGKTPVSVTVKNPDGQTFTLPSAFTWTGSPSAPSISSPSPTSQKGTDPDSCGGL